MSDAVRSGLPRWAELVAVLVLLVLALPILVLSALVIVLVDGRPVVLRQPREGARGVPFALCKLRTMRRDAARALADHLDRHPARRAEWERFRRLSSDPRLLPGIGRVLRRLSIDELPQLWNVLRGEMRLVGPRPLELDIAAGLPAAVRERRALVAPGLTGLWQVSGRSELSIDEMTQLDLEYLERRSLGTDLAILWRTPRAVLGGRGAY